jgi:hypothetical protein
LGAISFSHGFVAATIATLVIGLWILPDKHVPLMSAPFSLDTVSEIQGTDVVGARAVMDVLTSGEDMDFLENLEMYEWLAEYG